MSSYMCGGTLWLAVSFYGMVLLSFFASCGAVGAPSPERQQAARPTR